MGKKLGFSIGHRCFGYGLVIPHYGTIVVGPTNKIGNFAVLHTSSCIASVGSVIGDGFYLSPGAKITKKVVLGDSVTIGANSVVNKSFLNGNVLIAGMPGKVIKESIPWYERDGEVFKKRHDMVESLRKNI